MNKICLKYFLFSVLFSFVPSLALTAINVGAGYTSFTSAQQVPSLTVQLDQSGWSWDVTSTGYASQYDYFSGYTSNYYWPYRLGSFLGGDIDAGFGFGAYYTLRGYRDTLSTAIKDVSDFGVGPSFNVKWSVTSWFFIRSQSLMGVGHVNNLALYFQDASTIAVGFQW